MKNEGPEVDILRQNKQEHMWETVTYYILIYGDFGTLYTTYKQTRPNKSMQHFIYFWYSVITTVPK